MPGIPTTIPTIDLAGLETVAGCARVAAAMSEAYSQWGFAYIVNHGVEDTLVASVFDASRRFHAQPLDAKQAIAVNRGHRGYIALASSTDVASSIEAADQPNHSEFFIKLRELEPDELTPDNPLAAPNQWPAEETLPDFRTALGAYEAAVEQVARGLVRAMAVAFGLEPHALDPGFVRPTTWLRLLHYPARPADAPSGLYGSAPHTDFGCLTILAQDAVGGLQVRTPEGDWIDVPPVAGSFVVNTGDIVPVWSGGRWRSTPHRVVNPSGAERYSVAYFFDPSFDTEVKALTGEASSSTSFHFGDHVRQQLDATYSYRQDDT